MTKKVEEKATKLAFVFGGRELCNSWAQLLEHPEIHSIDDGRKEFPDSGEMEIYISIHDGVVNPVTGEKGGGFFVGSFKDALDHFRCDWD